MPHAQHIPHPSPQVTLRDNKLGDAARAVAKTMYTNVKKHDPKSIRWDLGEM